MRAGAVLLAILVLAASCARDRQPRRDAHAVALFIALGDGGAPTLFQVAPGERPVAVDLGGDPHVLSAVAAPGGTAVALVVRAGGEHDLLVFRSGARSPRREKAPAGAIAARAVSDDGRVVVLDTGGGQLVAVDQAGRTTEIDARALGTLMYGVALSRDGARLAFSTMRAECSRDATKMQTCPVGLYGVELRGGDARPRPIAVAEDSVSYDPWFVGGDGGALLYMTSADDVSEPCRQSVNRCGYTIRRAPFAGGAGERLLDDAILARRAPDGVLFYRRLTRNADGVANWSSEELWVAKPGGAPPVKLRDDVLMWYHHVSPDGRFVALLAGDRDVLASEGLLEILDRSGRPAGNPVIAADARVVGWAVRPLPAGEARLAPYRSLRQLREALADARRRARGAAVAVHQVPGRAYGELDDPPPRLDDVEELLRWWRDDDRRVAVVGGRYRFCDLQRRGRHAGVHLSAAAAWGEDLIVAGRSTPAPPPATGGPALASFDGSSARGGRVELVAVELPARVRAGDRFDMTLTWRVIEPPQVGWRVFVHFDDRTRFQADHVAAVCGTADWQPGDVVVDRFGVDTAGAAPGAYRAYVGWYVSTTRARGPAPDDRAEVGTIVVER